LETPLSRRLGKFLPDQDRPNEGVFSFQDVAPEAREQGGSGQWLSLRYDLTAPLARYVAENAQRLPKPFRRYAVGNVWRNEKPGPGRFRQFMQFDADTVGAESVAADAEMCMLAADTMERWAEGGARDQVKPARSSTACWSIGVGGKQHAEAAGRTARHRQVRSLRRQREYSQRSQMGGDFTEGAGHNGRDRQVKFVTSGSRSGSARGKAASRTAPWPRELAELAEIEG
jgi:histidyl-tRNA synthetase